MNEEVKLKEVEGSEEPNKEGNPVPEQVLAIVRSPNGSIQVVGKMDSLIECMGWLGVAQHLVVDYFKRIALQEMAGNRKDKIARPGGGFFTNLRSHMDKKGHVH